jgi:hypothetical protein
MLTDEVVLGLKPGEQVFDTEVVGLGARRQRRTVSFVLRTFQDGKQRLQTLGSTAEMTVAAARDLARRVKAGEPLPPRRPGPLGPTPLARLKAVMATLPPADRFRHPTLPPAVLLAQKQLHLVNIFLQAEGIGLGALGQLSAALGDLVEGRSALLLTPAPKDEGKPGSPGMRRGDVIEMSEVAVKVAGLVRAKVPVGLAVQEVSRETGHPVAKVKRWHVRCFGPGREELPTAAEA